MKRDFTHENFEHFLKQSADNLRMRAPDKIWQNVSKELHKRRRRLIIGVSAFLLLASGTTYFIVSTTVHQEKTSLQSFTQQLTSRTEQPVSEKKTISKASVPQQSLTVNSIHRTNTAVVSFPSKNRNRISEEKSEEQSANLTSPLIVVNEPEAFSPTVADSDPEPAKANTDGQTESAIVNEVKQNKLPLTIESVVNSYKVRSQKPKWETQLYITPSISYRKLTENKSYLRSITQSPAAFTSLYSSVNSNVTHKPDVGIELGLTTKYALSDNVKLRGGLQFNVNRYDVKAFSSSYSLTTIALNNGVRVDSLNTFSNYSNVNGYKSNWLQNLYFQVSVPIGLEINFKGNDKVHFGIASTIQPTYVLGDRAYLITTDYKSYAQVPWLVRRWNVNTALETFVVYDNGKRKWQFGPQVRYQLLSSFVSKYPVKENLFDFGLKVGMSLGK